MKIDSILAREEGGALWYKRRGDRSRRACTVSEAVKILGRTRRQVYRYIEDGTLPALDKFLGEWLLDFSSVEQAAARPLSRQPLPEHLGVFFPEYSLLALNAGRDRVLIMARLLDGGGMGAVRWLFNRYKLNELRVFLKQEGKRLLSARSLRWWSLVLNVEPRALPSWRAADPWRRMRP
ncbi:MAG: hypothetical protein A3J74_06750 [Elusimicrobia bacterium RIFCSPHIGHO2_02_FULL_57_9]|nr:MAG: hypothetical protein A3J74_06750 [Elusimicrobia bacterium RIFCSPHIGHO2_02_FULL_57_9]